MGGPISRRTFALAAAAALASGAARAAGRWEARAAIPWTVQEVYGCAWRGQVMIAGGMSPDAAGIHALDRTGLYDPAADRWREGPRLPAARHHPALAAAADRVFAFGGFSVRGASAWIAEREVFAFDGSRWTPAAPMPRIQCETVALSLGGRIHLVSGRAPPGQANGDWRDHADVATHQVFDPASGRWSTARPCPAALNSATGAVIDGKLYLAGGRTVGGGNLARLDRYDPQRDAWESLAPVPAPSGGLGGAAIGDRFYVFGGETPRSVIAQCWSYDPGRDAWSPEPDMGVPRHGLAGVAVGGWILAVGGAVRPGVLGVSAVTEAFVPA